MTSKKLAHSSSTQNTIDSKYNQVKTAYVSIYISLIYNWEKYFQAYFLRCTYYKIKP